MKRREVLKSMFALSMMGIAGGWEETKAASQYSRTPRDGEGPYYPVERQKDEDYNLIQVAGQSGQAQGNILNFKGVVLNTSGQPQKGAIVDIWQADPKGQYKHPGDYTPGQRDANFQYWGKATTQADGTYYFRTVIPGHYSGRPPHIHYKVWMDGKVRLTSQIYFKNHPQNHVSGFKAEHAPLQTMDLEPVKNQEFGSFFQIVV